MTGPCRQLAPFALAIVLMMVSAVPGLAAPYFTDTALGNGSALASTIATPSGGTRLVSAYYTQKDGSVYERSNCGIAAIAMTMAAFGHVEPLTPLRESVNLLTGDWYPDSGIDWRHLILALEQRGFAVSGPYADDGFRHWTVDEMLAEVQAGRPVVALVHQRSLPGHEQIDYAGDHYVVFLGVTGDGSVVYHDSALAGASGAFRISDRATFERAWSHTWIGQNNTAMAVYRP